MDKNFPRIICTFVTGEEYSDEVAEGKICYQSVPISSEVPEGTSVSFRVSLGQDPEKQDPEPPPSPNVSPDPNVASSPEVTPTPPPNTQPVVPVYRQVVVELPQDGRDVVSVRIQVGDNASAYENPAVETSMLAIYANVRGTGIQEVTIYIDEVAVKTYTEDFSS